MTSRTLTILLVDIKGFTPRAAGSSRRELAELLDKFRGLIKPVITRCGGRVIKELGDAFLVTFESPTNAVAAGTLLQQLFRDRNKGVPEDQRIEVRVAIHSGEVEESGGDVIGDAVNVASRVESVTEVGEVYFTETVFLTMNRSEVPSSEVGERVLKGVPQPVKLYRVLQDPADDRYWRLLAGGGELPGTAPKRSRALLGVIALVAAAVLAAAGLAVFLIQRDAAVRRARKLAEEGRHADAVEALSIAYEQDVPPPEALELVEESARLAVEKHISAKEFSAARDLAGKWAARWTSLRNLPVTVALAESDHLVAGGGAQAAVEVIKTAIGKHDSWRLHMVLSRLYARPDVWAKAPGGQATRGWYYEAVDEIVTAVQLGLSGESLPPELKNELWERFANQAPVGSQRIADNAAKLCELVHRHLWPEYREKLVAGAADPDHALRTNSMTVLEKAGEVGSVDMIAHQAWNTAYSYWNSKHKAGVAYLRNLKDPAGRKRAGELLAKVRAQLEKELAEKKYSHVSDALAEVEKLAAELSASP